MTVSKHDQETWDEYQAKLTPWRLVWLKLEAPGISPHNEVNLEYVCTSGETCWLMLERPESCPKLWFQERDQVGPIYLAKLQYIQDKDCMFPTPQWVELWGRYDIGYWSLLEVLDAKKYYFRWLVEYEVPPNPNR